MAGTVRKKTMTFSSGTALSAALSVCLIGFTSRAGETAIKGIQLAEKHKAVWSHDVFSRGYVNSKSSSGIPLGNGDFKAIIGRSKDNVQIMLLKNDFW